MEIRKADSKGRVTVGSAGESYEVRKIGEDIVLTPPRSNRLRLEDLPPAPKGYQWTTAFWMLGNNVPVIWVELRLDVTTGVPGVYLGSLPYRAVENLTVDAVRDAAKEIVAEYEERYAAEKERVEEQKKLSENYGHLLL